MSDTSYLSLKQDRYSCKTLCPCNTVCGPPVNIWSSKGPHLPLILHTNGSRPNVKIGVVRDSIPGLVNLDSTGSLISGDPGFGPEVTRLVCQKLNLNCEMYLPDEPHYGELKNQTWLGMLGAINDGTYDTSLPTFTLTIDRIDHFLFPSYFFRFPLAFVSKSPRQNNANSLEVLLGPFSTKVWLATIGCFFLIALTLLTSKKKKVTVPLAHHRKFNRFLSGALYFFEAVVNVSLYLARKGPTIRRLSSPGHVVLAFYGLSTLILISYYTAKLRNAMLKDAPKLPFHNMKTLIDCIETQQCRMVFAPPGFYFLDAVMRSNQSSDYFSLRKAFLTNPPLTVDGEEEMLRKIRNTSNIYLVSYPGLKRRYLRQMGSDCSLTMVDYEAAELDTYPFRWDDSQLTNDFSKVLALLDRSGIVQKLMADSPSQNLCESVRSSRVISVQPLSINIVAGATWLLLSGCIFASVALLSEIFCRSILKPKFT